MTVSKNSRFHGNIALVISQPGRRWIKMAGEKSDVNISINLDTTPVLYTDNVHIKITEDGVTLDFMQKLGPTKTVRIVSRVGMSREHARKFYKVLGDQLKLAVGQMQTGTKVRN
ncbi:hypothetical protein A2Z33_01690 [Candidatus Gottesmanbacteria bacterium RBG_16_52_11]|uniref:Uncharacterized protein n=1 Tax=Candidatus Gottesmanbacteria bacterium RBG_16_52_11 TaxID=1798374 RepID=A0A1F5YP05_9BACT|nr:MAG: hypothetical protein A2Z33_01690 [Candidatus Gottesmanbacteria bacterium RBG_16_52_11]